MQELNKSQLSRNDIKGNYTAKYIVCANIKNLLQLWIVMDY